MYTQQISESLGLPALLLFLIDQSGSMSLPWAGSQRSKAEQVADVINRLWESVVTQCSKGERTMSYFHVGCIGYGGSGTLYLIGSAGQPTVTASDLKANVEWERRWKKVPDGAGGIIDVETDLAVWLRPQSAGNTPMHDALSEARRVVTQWFGDHSNSFPPIVFNITDGQPDDPAAVEETAKTLCALRTNDGEVLLFNCHISETAQRPLAFPATDSGLPDEFARLLFRISSILPEIMLSRARSLEYELNQGARAFVYNADQVDLVQMLDVGTRPLNALLTAGE
jgi:hypothetical protein